MSAFGESIKDFGYQDEYIDSNGKSYKSKLNYIITQTQSIDYEKEIKKDLGLLKSRHQELIDEEERLHGEIFQEWYENNNNSIAYFELENMKLLQQKIDNNESVWYWSEKMQVFYLRKDNEILEIIDLDTPEFDEENKQSVSSTEKKRVLDLIRNLNNSKKELLEDLRESDIYELSPDHFLREVYESEKNIEMVKSLLLLSPGARAYIPTIESLKSLRQRVLMKYKDILSISELSQLLGPGIATIKKELKELKKT